MGVYTANRTLLNNEPAHVEADMAYATEGGAMMMVSESYVNDLTVFEAVLRRDFVEATANIYGTSILEAESDKADGNILQKMWANIIKLVNMIKSKIKSIVDSFSKKMAQWRKDYYAKKVSKLKNDFKKADLTNVKFKEFKAWNARVVDGDLGAAKVSDALKAEVDFGTVGKTAKEVAEKATKRKDAEKVIYGKILGEKSLDAKAFKERLHKMVYPGEVVEYPFREDTGLKNRVITILESVGTDADGTLIVKKAKAALMKDLDNKEKEAKKMLSAAKKMDKGDARKDAIAHSKACAELVSIVQRCAGNILSAYMSEEKSIISTAVKLFSTGAAYASGFKAKKAAKAAGKATVAAEAYRSVSYLQAVAESDVYELECALEDDTVVEESTDFEDEDMSYSFE